MVRLSWYHGLVLHVLRSQSALTAGGICRILNARGEDVEHALRDLAAAGQIEAAPGFSVLRCFVTTQGALQTGNPALQPGHRRPSEQSANQRRAQRPSVLQRKVGRRRHKKYR